MPVETNTYPEFPENLRGTGGTGSPNLVATQKTTRILLFALYMLLHLSLRTIRLPMASLQPKSELKCA